MNAEQRKNLKTLAIWVLVNKPTIHMTNYVVAGGDDEDVTQPSNVICGTASCFAGHGPVAGIDPTSDDDWDAYTLRCFGTKIDRGLGSWHFLFSPVWPDSVDQCVARAYRVLRTGVPDVFSCKTQYEVPTLEELQDVN